MKRRRNRKGPLVQAAVLSLAAVATALVVLAGRRRAIDDGVVTFPADGGDGASAPTGMGAPTLTGTTKR
ncbi:hypothetical protein ABZ807_24650 [Micromonospora sp. NPDC047548]|uniref:hypothetical protein n=1 Tax=Micromonospora sp. NPDC047548 TaxID=3155624 RepID=UPI0033F95E91